ncbi:hypothetical protein PUN49_08870 [Pseudomonas extremaustralis]|nr:Sir2 family NAD-dependent protein deacetylase [Pseudomonas extremaustralis]MDG2967143.1 hypothetical protein [Pseudomonas extremaustralis]UUJ39581.1 hypothetical protein L1A22_23165 [Pseudomonas extremaustralis]
MKAAFPISRSIKGSLGSVRPADVRKGRDCRESSPLVWGWYLWRCKQVVDAALNAAHIFLSKVTESLREVSVITQNVGDLHERARSVAALYLHGSLSTPKCCACHRQGAI